MGCCTGKPRPTVVAIAKLEPCRNSVFRSAYGSIAFESLPNARTRARVQLHNFAPGFHGFHVHHGRQRGTDCSTACKHYDDRSTTLLPSSHGGPTGTPRHAGDFGNVLVDKDGHANVSIIADVDATDLLGRTAVIHAQRDDLGRGGDAESLRTGNSGRRVAAGVILPVVDIDPSSHEPTKKSRGAVVVRWTEGHRARDAR